MDMTTRRLVPLVCFHCAMPLNNKQQTFDVMVARKKMTVGEVLDYLHIDNMCCRVVMARSADDTRLHRVLVVPNTFVPIHRASKLESAVFTVRADGTSDPV
jgi:DNA-directed RNA polymerase subunit N (RpoN/RPB10)